MNIFTQCIVPLAVGLIAATSQLAEAAAGRIVTGTDTGPGPHVKAFSCRTQTNVASFFAWSPSFSGGVRVAAGDVNGDGAADLITGTGPGAALLTVFSGRDQSALHNFMPYGSFTGGIYVAAGDVNGDGIDDLVTGTAVTTPHVKVFNGSTGSEIYSFFAYAAGFAGGVRVASGDINGDGRADIVTGAGPGGSGHVKVFDGANLTEIRSFLAYGPSFPAGVFVAAGDVNGDGKADIVTGADSGAAAHVKVFDGVTLAQLQSFFAYAPPFVGGVRVAAGDMNGDGRAEILTTPGGGGAPYVRVFDGLTLAETAGFYAYAVSFTNGVFISAASVQRPRLEISPTRSPQEVQLRWPSGCVCQLEASIDPSNPQGWTVQDVQPTENGTRLGLLLPAVQKIQVFRLKCDDEAVR